MVKEEKTTSKPSGQVADLIEKIEKLSVLELNELVKALEEKFGVAAMFPLGGESPLGGAVPAGGTPAPAAAGEAKAEETAGQTTFNVTLAEIGPNKISVIKAVREVNQTLGLKEAKDLVEGKLPVDLLTGVNKETAEGAKKRLEEVGAKVELK